VQLKLKVFIPEVEEPESLKRLEGLAEIKTGMVGQAYTEDDLAREMLDVEVVVITSQHHITRNVIERSPKLRGIVKYGSKPGLDNVDMGAANEKKILVAYTEGANSDSVAEFAIMLAFALIKRLPNAMTQMKNHAWRDASCLGIEMADKTFGILGLGVIGSKVAHKLSGFGVRVIATDPYISKQKADLAHASVVDLEDLLRESDVLSLHAKVTDETRHMIGKKELGLMKRTAYLINTARGALIDEQALYQALREGRIAGAALDAFETEPPSPDNPLLKLNNVILTPHIASWTSDALQKEANMAMEEVRNILLGIGPKHLANP
jgi:D-3-phosphoglycerate dehydrogenase